METDAIDASWVGFVTLIQEHSFDAARLFGHGGGCSKEPAVTEFTLVDISSGNISR